MTLQVKMISLIVALMLLLGMVYHIIELLIILPGYLSLETQLAAKDMGRCQAAIEAEIKHLDSLVNDWAVWDDSYRFMDDRNTQYIRSNLVDDTFVDNRLNLIYYYDTQGNSKWGRAFDLDAARTISLPPFDKGRLDPAHPLLYHRSVKSSNAGLILTDRGVMLFSSRPVVTSNYSGPSRGSLIMGRLLSQADRTALVEQTGVQHHFWAVNAANLPLDAQLAIRKLSESRPYISVAQGNHHLVAYDTMPDYQGRAVLLIRCEIPRQILSGGRTSVHIARISFLSAMILILIVLVVLLQRIIVVPITHLKAHTTRIRKTRNLSLRSSMHGKDEIGNLSIEFDRMVEKLERYNERLRALSTRLLQVEAQERRKLAAFLHDHIVQSMTIAKIKLDELAKNNIEEKWAEHLDDIGGLVDESIQKARTMTFELSPQILYELGLVPALEWLADRFYQKHKLVVHMTNDRLKSPIDDTLSAFLFQASREFLFNIVKHASATEAMLKLAVNDDTRWATLTVEDNGVGFPERCESTPPTDGTNLGFGLFTIWETACHMGGSLLVGPGSDGGTLVKLTMPMVPGDTNEMNGDRL